MQLRECEREIVLEAGVIEEISWKKIPLTRKSQDCPSLSVLKIDPKKPKP
jgi:hypothetical protein